MKSNPWFPYGTIVEERKMNEKQERRVKDAEEIKSISDWVVAWLVGIGTPLIILAIVGAIVMAAIGFIRWTISWGAIGG